MKRNPETVHPRMSPPRVETHRRAFSLAELMIALVILGLGLLFIAAALPAGLEYTRQTVDKANAEAAGSYALDEIEAALRTSNDLYDHTLATLTPPVIERLDCVHRPRERKLPMPPSTINRFPVHEVYEPFFKVRPLVVGNIRVGPTTTDRELVDDTEQVISAYLLALGLSLPNDPLEYDLNRLAGTGLSLGENPVLPGVTRVYPPIQPVAPYDVLSFMQDRPPYPQYLARYLPANNVLTFEQRKAEREKALDARVGWTAFYRRVSYEIDDPDGTPGNGDETAADPLTYEIIVVVTRRTSRNHRFARQDLTNGAGLQLFEQPHAAPADFSDPSPNPPTPGMIGLDGGSDRLAPTPWLIVFDHSSPDPALPLMETFGNGLYDTTPGSDRVLLPNTGFTPPPTLTFHCTPEVDPLLPVGSVLIPAFNDARYVDLAAGIDSRQSGFVPAAPEALPIYEITDRPDRTTVVVKNNGYYPWLRSRNANDTQGFPCWIIPPCFAERANGQPVYDRSSPIIRVFRETIQIPEIHR